jgi:hypothetical protein
MTKRRAAPQRAAVREPPREGVSISPAAIKWIAGTLAAIFAAVVAWWQIWDRVDNHWRLETIQKAQDDKLAADVKAAREKAEADVKATEAKIKAELATHKERDASSSAWTLYVIQDFRAAVESKWASDCIRNKAPVDICREQDRKAQEASAQASNLKAQAQQASKEKP